MLTNGVSSGVAAQIRRLDARVTECSMVPPDNFLHNYCSFSPLHTKTCISSHAPSRNRQMTVRFTGRSLIVVFSVGTCLISPCWCLEFRRGVYIFGAFVDPWSSGLFHCVRSLSFTDVSEEHAIPIFSDPITFR
jgi:hypothetical protein